MSIAKPRILILSLACAAGGACKKDVPPPVTGAPVETARPAAPALTIDESKLPPVNRFTKADLDTSKNACVDFAGYVNAKYLAANPIPSDRTSWGAFEMLDERSTGVQRQLAEQSAADAGADGVKKLVGDLWSTGMDEAKINAQGIEPIKGRLAAIDALTDAASIAEHLRVTTARGEMVLFGFGPEADFKDSSMNMAYVVQAGLGLPDKTYYVDADKQKQRDAYLAHIGKVLELSGVAAADAAKQAR